MDGCEEGCEWGRGVKFQLVCGCTGEGSGEWEGYFILERIVVRG